MSLPIEKYRRSERIRKIVESTTKPSQHPKEGQPLVDQSQATKNRASKPLVNVARGAKTTTQSKKAIDSSTTNGRLDAQSQKSRATPRGSEGAAAPRSHPGKDARVQSKSTAGAIEPTHRVLGSDTQTRSSGTSKRKTYRPRGDTSQARGRRPKAHLTPAAEYLTLPLGSQQVALNSEPRSRHPLEQSRLPNRFAALSKEALEAHTLDSAPSALEDQIRVIKRISGRVLTKASPEARSSGTIDIDPQEKFN